MPDPFIEFGNLVPDVVSSYGTDSDQRVRETRAKLYRETPNDNMKQTPLTKIVMSNLGESKQAPEYEWGMESHDDRYVEATAAHDNSNLASAIGATTQTAAGSTVYLQMAADSARQLVKYEEIEMRLLHNTVTHDDHDASLMGMVTAKTIDGANSYLTVTLYEDDEGNGGADGNVLGRYQADTTNNRLIVSPISPAMPEGSALPWTRYREATEKKNYIQTIMAGLGLTGEELSNAQRFNETTYKRYWRQVFDQFNRYIERAILFGTRRHNDTVDVDMGAGEQTLSQYRTGGLLWMFKHADFGGGKNIFDIRTTTTFQDYDFTGKTWEEGGYDYFKLLLEYLSRKSGKNKKLICSAQMKLAILNLFESMTQVHVNTSHKDKWGFDVTRIEGMNADLEIMQHADFSCNPAWQRMGVIIEPDLLWACEKKGRGMTVIRSTKDLKDKSKVQDGFGWRDATKEGIFTTFGFGVDNLDGMCVIKGLGEDFSS